MTGICLSLVLAAGPLPAVQPVELKPLQANGRQLLATLDDLHAALPPETARGLLPLLYGTPADPDAAAARVQQLLDPHCLIAVSINPESRVKAARGPAPAVLRLDRETVVLVKVHNEAGVTHALTVSGPQLRRAGRPADARWLDAHVRTTARDGRRLSGHTVEYVALRLTPHAAGKREATLRFDVGQGTQDLGFRAEVPVLFTVQPGGTPGSPSRTSPILNVGSRSSSIWFRMLSA